MENSSIVTVAALVVLAVVFGSVLISTLLGAIYEGRKDDETEENNN